MKTLRSISRSRRVKKSKRVSPAGAERVQYFHGSTEYFDRFVPGGKCVTPSKCYARYYARRQRKGKGYIYALWLDPHADLKDKATETHDAVLARKVRFCERIPLTKELNKECDTDIARIVASLEGEVGHPKP